MKSQLKRALALLLCLGLTAGLFSAAALAESSVETGAIAPADEDDKGGTILPTDGELIDEQPIEDAVVGTDVPYYAWKQSDPQWRDLYIGTRTLGEAGCAVASLAMLIVHAGLRDETIFDPGTFLEEMKSVGGFYGNEVCWGKAGEAVEGFHYAGSIDLRGTEGEKVATIQHCCEMGYLIVAAVKDFGHYVAVRSAASGSVTMMDPGSGSTDLFSKYDADGVVRLYLYSLEEEPALPEALEAYVSLIVGGRATAFRGLAGGIHSERLSYYPN